MQRKERCRVVVCHDGGKLIGSGLKFVSSDSNIKHIELEKRLKKAEEMSYAKPLSGVSRIAASGDNIFSERMDGLRNRDQSRSVHLKSRLTGEERLSKDMSQGNESRSLLKRMKDEFRQSTNTSAVHGMISMEKLSGRGIDLGGNKGFPQRPRVIGTDTPLDQSRNRVNSFNNMRNEFYGRIAKQKLEGGSGGTLDNLFSILSNDKRRISDKHQKSANIRESQPSRAELHKILITDQRSDGIRGSSKVDYSRTETEQSRLFGLLRSDKFPFDLVKQLRTKLNLLTSVHMSPEERESLQLLAIDINNLIGT